ncbi:MAG: hypothetical protein ACTHN0_00975 [Aquihabitans sp.]
MTGSSTTLVLLGSLEPSEPLSSTVAFLEWCRTAPDAPDVEVLALHPGTAAEQVRALAPTTVVYDPHGWSLPRIVQRVGLQRPAALLRAAELKRRLRVDGPVYVPDPAGAGLLHRLGPKAGPVITHLHATSSGLDRLPPADRDVLAARTDRWIVGSDAMAAEARATGTADGDLVALPDLLTLPGIGELDADFLATVRSELADRHGIPTDAALAIGVGNVDWWTVPDAFVRVAWEATRRTSDRPLHFLWVADGATDRMLWPLRHDIRHAGLEDRVHIETGPRRPWHLIAAGDVLVSSRLGGHEPIGHREAALMGRPVLWFDDPEAPEPLVEPGQGTAVAHLDVDAMAEAIVDAVRTPAADPADPTRLTSGTDATWLPAIGGPAIAAQLRRR